ncbi:MAG: hydantoinase/oxoprolinase family protein, partial [Acidobacteriota bacterium]
MLRIGIDTGGTFTDFVVHEDGKMSTFKLPSTPAQPEQAVIEGLRKIINNQPSFLVRYGSTVATNALLERKGAKTVLVTNQGFEDILEIGRQNRPGLYSLAGSKPVPLIPSKMRIGVKERTLHDGSQLEPLEKKSLDWLSGRMGQLKPESIAVALLYSYLNPDSEKAIEEALRSAGVPISLSHRIHPEFREYERTSATVINAYLTPTMVRYLTALGMDPVMEKGKLTIMQSNGGAISGEVARNEPVRTLLSGPAGGVVGAFRIAQQAGFERIITLDMGGTSTDACLCDGQISITNEAEIEHLPVPTPMIPIHTIGAGGGSIAHVDAGGLLRVGPQSAGADPGPVA